MKFYTKYFPIIFGLIALAQLYSTFHPYTLDWLNYLSKPLIMISLLLWYVGSSSGKGDWYKAGIVAIVFSLFGDVFLMFQEDRPSFFMLGLGSFLIAHIAYALAFSKALVVPEIPIIKKYPLVLAVFGIYGFWVFAQLRSNLHELELPVLIYMIAILVMGIAALNRFGRVSRKSFFLVMIGALLFIASDSIIAFSKFSKPIEEAGFWIMLTYIIAQYFIVRGLRQPV